MPQRKRAGQSRWLKRLPSRGKLNLCAGTTNLYSSRVHSFFALYIF